jgi:phosphatidylserine decarboxylase
MEYRNPISGLVKYFNTTEAHFSSMAAHPKQAMKEPTYVVEGAKQSHSFFVSEGALAVRLYYLMAWYVESSGDRVKQGNEFGFIKFGSRV